MSNHQTPRDNDRDGCHRACSVEQQQQYLPPLSPLPHSQLLTIQCKPMKTTPSTCFDNESFSLSEDSNSCLSVDSTTSIGCGGLHLTSDSLFCLSFSREQEREWEAMAERRRTAAARRRKGKQSIGSLLENRRKKMKERIVQLHPKHLKEKAKERIDDYVDMVSDLLQYRLPCLPSFPTGSGSTKANNPTKPKNNKSTA